MEDSFALLSTMYPKLQKKYKKAHQKKPSKLALKKNIRRSSIFDNLPTTAPNNSLILVEDSTTDASNSNSSNSRLSDVNSKPITIYDSDSCESENYSASISSNKIHKVQNDYGLSESKCNTIDKWISNVQIENTRPSSCCNDLYCVSPKTPIIEKDKFDELLNNENRKQEFHNYTDKNSDKQQNISKQLGSSGKHEAKDLMAVKNINRCENGNGSNMVIPISKINDSVSSTSDIIEGSDDNVNSKDQLNTSLLDDLYGAEWKNSKNILLPRSEPRYKKKNTNTLKTVPKTEVKTKARFSIVHKNPYLDFMQKQQHTPTMQNKTYLETPWTKRLQALCDSDSSDNSFNGVSEKYQNPVRAQLFSANKTCDSNIENSDNKISQIDKILELALKKPKGKYLERYTQRLSSTTSTDSEKENLSDFSIDSETLEDRVRKKMGPNKKTKEIPRIDKESLRKFYTHHLLKGKECDKISHKTDTSINLEKKYYRDFSDDSEPLEDKLNRKLRLNVKSKLSVPKDKNPKQPEGILKHILNVKYNNFNNDGKEVPNKAELDNSKLPKKNTVDIKKKRTVKAKTVRKKPLSPSEDSSSDTKTNKKNNQKYIASSNSHINSDNVKSFLASLSESVPTSQCDPSARIFRNNFKTYRSQLVTKLFTLYNDKIFDRALPEDTLIEWSERMRGTAGYCYCKKITRSTGLIERKARLVLASKVLDRADRLRDTLIHEMCHAATWIVNQVSDGHGSYWKAWARKARETFPELPPIKVCHSYSITTKYTYRCTSCGYSFGRHSKSLDIERKRCGRCYGVFEVLINKISKGGETTCVPITPKRAPTGFALFVKENYATYKSPQLNHGQVMKLLGQKFNELKVSVCE